MEKIFNTLSFALRNYHMHGQYVNDVVLEQQKDSSLEINVLTSMPVEQKRIFAKDCLQKLQTTYKFLGYDISFHLYNSSEDATR